VARRHCHWQSQCPSLAVWCNLLVIVTVHLVLNVWIVFIEVIVVIVASILQRAAWGLHFKLAVDHVT
jgi:hypothetical protein